MYFYKELLEDNTYRYCMTTLKRMEINFEEITQEEYEEEINRQLEESFNEIPEEPEEISYEELLAANAELEAENAALLFQLLTGEEFVND